MVRLGIVAYEVSADRLGEGLIRELQRRIPDLDVQGVVGEALESAGCRPLMPAESFAVMGLVEVLRHLPFLLAARRRLARHFRQQDIQLFIGIDAPDFNLGLERRLRQAGIATLHYVSPSVWAWRQGRVRSLREAANQVLTIFPFEADFLCHHGVPARYVGHPLARRIPSVTDQQGARQRLGLAATGEVVALLPGSRMGEVSRLAGPFLVAAKRLAETRPGIRFVLPTTSPRLRSMVEQAMTLHAPGLDCRILDQQSYTAMSAADVVLTASGTATVEAMLHGRPMVVGYRLHWLSYQILRRMVRVPYIAMANLLCQAPLAPELIQQDCTPERLAAAVAAMLDDAPRRQRIAARYAELHAELLRDSDCLAADAVEALLAQRMGR